MTYVSKAPQGTRPTSNSLTQFLARLVGPGKDPATTLSEAERRQLVGQIVARQNGLRALAERARARLQAPAADKAGDGSIAVGPESSLRLDPDTKTWRYHADAKTEPVAVEFGGVRYGVAEAPTVTVDTNQRTFSVQLPRTPAKLTVGAAPSELLRRALSRKPRKGRFPHA